MASKQIRSIIVGLFIVTGLDAAAPPPSPKMPLTKLLPAKKNLDQCLLRYRITTRSPECQDYFDQGLGYLYSYVWMEAARSFETALRHDPDCPLAWWGLARAMERWGRGDATKAVNEAWNRKDRASPRERLLLRAAMEEKGLLPNVGDAEKRKQKAIATIDELLALHDDDEEAWFYRGQLAGGSGLFGGSASSVPFYKALLRVNPLHPGANHELLHYYENFQRPALGWPYAEAYIQSSPGLPHAFHMQAHLATRLGRWKKTSDRSARAIELQRAYHRREEVQPRDDGQYSHHLETLLVSLTHDGRFVEAREIVREAERCEFRLRVPFFRLYLAERDFDSALAMAEEIRQGGKHEKNGKKKGNGGRGGDKALSSYLSALAYLKMGNISRALPEIEVVRQARLDNTNDRKLDLKLWEIQGLYLCQTGEADAGLKLLKKTVDQTKDDYGHHSWGNGAYFMENWGIGALQVNRLNVAEEAFHEALAHDPGSVRAALGMEWICEKQGRSEEAERFRELARRCWNRANPGYLQMERAAIRGERVSRPDPSRQLLLN
ncbi:MAG: tetratricopeptide repeat protein [Gemmataceae bacterium]